MSGKSFRSFFTLGAQVWIAVGLIVVTLALYWPATRFGYVNFDDYLYTTENPIVADGLSAAGIRQAFASVHEQWWLPLLWISYMVDIELFGNGPYGHHLVNILLHAANAALLFWVLFRMTGSRWRSAFVAALFAWHPTRVEAVVWIAARKDTLSGLFFMLSLLAYVRHVQKPSARKMAWVFALMLMGLMSKAILVVLPPILLFLDYWPLKRARRLWGEGVWKEWRPLLLEKAALIGLAALFMALNLSTHVTGRGEGAPVSLLTRFGMVAPNYVDYLDKIALPIHLSAYYPENMAVSWPYSLAAMLLLMGVTYGILRRHKMRPYWTVGWLWFLVAILPIVQGVRMGLAQYADRWTYLPLIGLGIALAWPAAEWSERGMLRRAVQIAGGLILALCLVGSHAQLPWWKNSLVLFQRAVQLTPEAHFARNSLGLALSEDGRFEEAIAQFKLAIQGRPKHGDYYSNLGEALLKAGRPEEALAMQDEALRRESGKAFIYNNRGRALSKLGRREEARAAYEEALRLDPAHPEAHYNLGFQLYESGRAAEALPHFQVAVRGRPGSAPMWYNLGMAYAELGRYAEAEPCVAQALKLEPGMPGAKEALARIRMLML